MLIKMKCGQPPKCYSADYESTPTKKVTVACEAAYNKDMNH